MVPYGIGGSRAGIYANPLRTTHHCCELSIQEHAYARLLNRPLRGCEYHSCCIPSEEIFYCEEGDFCIERKEEFEPENCHFYQLEHRHERLRDWCSDGPCDNRMCIQAVVEPLATWRELEELESEGNWDPMFNQGERLRAQWEEGLFKHLERLNTLMEDTTTHAAVLRDVTADEAFVDPTSIALAARNYLQVKANVDRELVMIKRQLDWARTPSDGP